MASALAPRQTAQRPCPGPTSEPSWRDARLATSPRTMSAIPAFLSAPPPPRRFSNSSGAVGDLKIEEALGNNGTLTGGVDVELGLAANTLNANGSLGELHRLDQFFGAICVRCAQDFIRRQSRGRQLRHRHLLRDSCRRSDLPGELYPARRCSRASLACDLGDGSRGLGRNPTSPQRRIRETDGPGQPRFRIAGAAGFAPSPAAAPYERARRPGAVAARKRRARRRSIKRTSARVSDGLDGEPNFPGGVACAGFAPRADVQTIHKTNSPTRLKR